MFDRMVVSLVKNSRPILEKKKLWQGSKFKPDFPLHWKMYEFILIFFTQSNVSLVLYCIMFIWKKNINLMV